MRYNGELTESFKMRTGVRQVRILQNINIVCLLLLLFN